MSRGSPESDLQLRPACASLARAPPALRREVHFDSRRDRLGEDVAPRIQPVGRRFRRHDDAHGRCAAYAERLAQLHQLPTTQWPRERHTDRDLRVAVRPGWPQPYLDLKHCSPLPHRERWRSRRFLNRPGAPTGSEGLSFVRSPTALQARMEFDLDEVSQRAVDGVAPLLQPFELFPRTQRKSRCLPRPPPQGLRQVRQLQRR